MLKLPKPTFIIKKSLPDFVSIPALNPSDSDSVVTI
nr:MAG TPA: hypothetical protein [Caudoviricetes sp.]